MTADSHSQISVESLITTRRELHTIPEVGLHLPNTQAFLLERLQQAGIECRTGTGLSSIVAIVRGEAASDEPPRVLVRTDMDALPVTEETGIAFAADGGTMHACGHDLHMSIVLHAALAVQAHRAELTGDAVFMFQPGEEGHGGARMMLDEGLLDIDEKRPIAALGLHVLANHLPTGAIVSREGAVFGGSILLDIDFVGRGGHGSSPHLSRSPIPAAAEFITSSLTAVTNRISAFETAVLSYGTIQAGLARNVIPDRAELGGVIRFFDEETGRAVEQAVREIAEGIAIGHDLDVRVSATLDTLPTVSDGAELALLHEISPGSVERLDRPFAISEDFSWILREVPGVFVLVGAAEGDPATQPSNHSSTATFSEDVMLPATQLIVDWVFGRLEAASRVS